MVRPHPSRFLVGSQASRKDTGGWAVVPEPAGQHTAEDTDAEKLAAKEMPAKEITEVMETPLPAEKTAMDSPLPAIEKTAIAQSANPTQVDPADPALAWLSAIGPLRHGPRSI